MDKNSPQHFLSRICIHISLTFFSSQFKGQTCYFCYLKVPFQLPFVENTQIGALYNLFHFMHDKIIHTEIIFRNNEPLILQNQTCLLEWLYLLWNQHYLSPGQKMSHECRKACLTCVYKLPLSLLGVSDASAAVHGLNAHSSTLQCGSNLASLQLSSCIHISLALCITYEFLAFCNVTQSEQFLTELSEVLVCS